jgi:hypothetical protein
MAYTSIRSLLVSLFVFGILATLAASLVLCNYDFGTSTYAQKIDDSSLDIPGGVVNSKYLSIIDHKYIQGKLGYDTITGTIVNNVAKNISFATVYAALYDKNNILITMESGSVFVSLLKAGDKSSFAIDIFGVKGIDHYTLFPAGIPS